MSGRHVLITGGGKGIGRAIANAFCGQEDHVIIAGRDMAALEATVRDNSADLADRGGSITARSLDVSDEDSVKTLFDSLHDLDVLINNAGLAMSKPLAAHSLEDWEQSMRVNATGVFLCTRAALPLLKKASHGRIVLVASTAAKVGYAYTAAYTASKHAAVGFMRTVASEVAGSDITANAVCPGFVDSEMTERSIENIVNKTGRSHADAKRSLEKSSPLSRFVTPQEVAHSVLFLASTEAAAINGQTLVLDGGGIQQ